MLNSSPRGRAGARTAAPSDVCRPHQLVESVEDALGSHKTARVEKRILSLREKSLEGP